MADSCIPHDDNILPIIPQSCKTSLTVDDILVIVYKVFVILSWAAEAIAVILIVWAAIMYFTAAGDENKAGTAKKIIIGVVVGILIILMARWLLYLVTEHVALTNNVININELTSP